MPFTKVKENTRKRFNEVRTFLNYISSVEPSNPAVDIPLEVKVMKGLFYVHLYSALERSINDLIESTIILISSKQVKNNHFSPALLSIALVDNIKSLKDSSHSVLINKSVDIFTAADSTSVVKLSESLFYKNLQSVNTSSIEDAFKSFGIKDLKLDPREKATVNEVVDKRNAVAHGRDSASSVGERFRVDVLRDKMGLVSEVTLKLIDLIEVDFIAKGYIKIDFRKHYS